MSWVLSVKLKSQKSIRMVILILTFLLLQENISCCYFSLGQADANGTPLFHFNSTFVCRLLKDLRVFLSNQVQETEIEQLPQVSLFVQVSFDRLILARKLVTHIVPIIIVQSPLTPSDICIRIIFLQVPAKICIKNSKTTCRKLLVPFSRRLRFC